MKDESGADRRGAVRVDSSGSQSAATDGSAIDDYDRHIFFTAKTPAHGLDTNGGPLSVECSRCHTVSTVSPLQWARAHAPLFLWVPLMRYSRYAQCPACGQRAWVRLSLKR